jgi:hypothetical protein
LWLSTYKKGRQVSDLYDTHCRYLAAADAYDLFNKPIASKMSISKIRDLAMSDGRTGTRGEMRAATYR